MKRKEFIFIDEVLPPMTKEEQKKCFEQVIEISNEDSKRLAELDSLSHIPMA